MSGARTVTMMTAAMVGVMAIGPRDAAAQPAVTEPWPHGEPVSEMQQIGGTLTAFLFGFGLGHAVEGRWGTEGWKFTLIDGVATSGFFASTIAGIACEQHCEVLEATFVASMLVLSASRYFQIYDTAWGARRHNRRLEARRKRAGTMYGATEREGERNAASQGRSEQGLGVMPVIAPTTAGDGVVAGAVLRF